MTLVKPTILLVDGYNVMGACAKLQRIRDLVGLEAARRDLIEILTNYSAYQGLETEVVFDAYAQERRKSQEQVTTQLRISYTDQGQTADSYIERACALFFRHDVRRFHQRLVVATSDRAQWLTAVGYGAEWMSALKLIQAAQQAHQQLQQPRRSKASRATKTLLANSLDSQMQEKLARLRQDLLQRGQ